MPSGVRKGFLSTCQLRGWRPCGGAPSMESGITQEDLGKARRKAARMSFRRMGDFVEGEGDSEDSIFCTLENVLF